MVQLSENENKIIIKKWNIFQWLWKKNMWKGQKIIQVYNKKISKLKVLKKKNVNQYLKIACYKESMQRA